MEPEWSEAGALQSNSVAPAKRRAIEIAARLADEDEVVVADPVLTLPEPGQGFAGVRGHRH